MSKNPRLFFLDDDAERLQSLQSELAAWQEDWELQFFRFRKDLMAAIAEDESALFVTWNELRRSPGARVIDQVETQHPRVRCVLLAERDERVKLESQVGEMVTLLPASASTDELRRQLRRILAIETWLSNERLIKILADSGRVPSLPSVYLQVTELLNTAEASLEDVGPVVAQDLAISARLLHVVNSSYYGHREKISDIAQAVIMLGSEAVRNLVLAIQVFDGNGNDEDAASKLEALWTHSLEVAAAAKQIALHETGDRRAAEEAYTAGLFHDIGKLLLHRAAPEPFAEASWISTQSERPDWEIEEELVGCNHAEAGAYLLGVWQMPLPLIETVAFHHQPHLSPSSRFNALTAVHAANALVRGRTEGPESVRRCLDEAYLASVGCEKSFLEWIGLILGEADNAESVPDETPSATEASPPTASAAPPPPRPTAPEPTPDFSESVVADHFTGEKSAPAETAPVAERPRRALGFLPISAVAWAAACVAVVLALAWMMRPKTASESSVSALIGQAENLSGPFAEAIETSKTEMEAIVAEFPDDGAPAETVPAPAPAESLAEETPAHPEVAPVAPVAPVALPQTPMPTMALSGIYLKSGVPIAVINRRLLKVGDTIEGARVERITRSTVDLTWQGKSHQLKLE